MIKKSSILCLLASSLLLVACHQQEPAQQNTETAASSVTVKTMNSEVAASQVSASETVAASSGQDALENYSLSAFTVFGTTPNQWHFFVQPKEDGTNLLQMLAEGGVVNGEFEVRHSVDARGVQFSGKYNGENINLNISREICEDPQSGQKYEFKAVLDFGGKYYQGCALRESIEPAKN
ncbi:hypothetical protein [Neisseria arctica]|nr:hypothetical protein [Neisseria arctica]UOO86902.1 hypothetical protein LVJ86_01215 [Neisseria arctica]